MSRGRLVRWMLEEVGQPYRTELMDYANLKTPAYLAVNPMGKIPAIRHGQTVVTECAAICAYLADAFPQADLAPAPSDRARGPYYRWLFFAAGPLEAAVTDRRLGAEPTPEQRRMVGYGSFGEVLDVIEAAVAGRDHLAGDRFSAADLYVGSHLGFGMMFVTIEKRPAFVTYAERLQARPAFRRAAAIDDSLIPAPAPAPA
jgi:glutathione S-transferase